MKKHISQFFAITILSFMTISNLFAATYTKYDKISDIRNLENGAYIEYTGNAITTFYTTDGILIQDETGAIAIDSYDLSNACPIPVDAGFPNLKITNIKGIFYKSTSESMTRIEIQNETHAENIRVVERNIDITITDVAISDFFANPMQYECKPIRLSQAKTSGKNLAFEGNLIPIIGIHSIPTEATFIGYYGFNGSLGFNVPGSKYISSSEAFQTIVDLKDSQPVDYPVSVLNPVLVNRVVANPDGTTTLYIQYDQWWSTYGTMLKLPNNNANVEAGDSVAGIRGIYTPLTTKGDKVFGSVITQSEDNEIVIINRNNELSIGAIQELEYLKGTAITNYEAQLCSSPTGTIVKHGEKYFLRVKNSMSKEIDSVYIDGADFSKYVGTDHAVVGIVDAGVVNPGYATFVLRGENDILKDNYQFNSIAELKKAGRPLAVGVTYELLNPVLVTYKHQWNNADTELTGIHVQDETGGIFIFDERNIDVNPGDYVKNFKGTCVYYAETGAQLNLSGFTNYKVISENNAIDSNVKEVTIADLAKNRSKYSSTVVKLMGVKHDTRTVSNYGQTTTEKYLYAGDYEMVYTVWDYELYEVNNIVGIFDDGGYANAFSFIALSQEHITEGAVYNPTPTENTKENEILVIYNNNDLEFSSIVNQVEIYTINGQLISQKEINSTTMSINLNKGLYIVKAMNFDTNSVSVHKFIVK